MFCLFDLILYVPSTIFQLNRDGSSWVEPVLSCDKCVLLKAQGPQRTDAGEAQTLGLESPAPRSRVKHSTTALPKNSDYGASDFILAISLTAELMVPGIPGTSSADFTRP